MYKSECSKCRRVFETEIKYYNYICDECTQKREEEKKKTDLYLVEQFRLELEKAKASGDQEQIEYWTRLYNNAVANYIKKYGSI